MEENNVAVISPEVGEEKVEQAILTPEQEIEALEAKLKSGEVIVSITPKSVKWLHNFIDSRAKFKGVEMAFSVIEAIIDFKGLKGRLLSSSYTPESGPKFDGMLKELQRIYEDHQESGEVVVKYDTVVYFGRNA